MHWFLIGAKHRIIDCQFLVTIDITHCDEDNLPKYPNIWLTGMI